MPTLSTTISDEDVGERLDEMTMVVPTLSGQAYEKRERPKDRPTVFRHQPVPEQRVGPGCHRRDPVIRAQRQEWDFITVSRGRELVHRGLADESVWMRRDDAQSGWIGA